LRHIALSRTAPENGVYDRVLRRASNAKFTYYNAGLGACGQTNTDSDYIVAMSPVHWVDRNPCGEVITISYNGKSAQATVVDKCMGCTPEELDLTPALFQHFSSLDPGKIFGDWVWGSSGGTPEPPVETTTPRPPPPATTTSSTSTTVTPTSESESSTSQSSSTESMTSSQVTGASQSGDSTERGSSGPQPTGSAEEDAVPLGSLASLTAAFLRMGQVMIQSSE